jgi:hypothetical protein
VSHKAIREASREASREVLQGAAGMADIEASMAAIREMPMEMACITLHNVAATLFKTRRFRESLDAYWRCYETFLSSSPFWWYSLWAIASILIYRQAPCTPADEASLVKIDVDKERATAHRIKAAFTLVWLSLTLTSAPTPTPT